MVSLKTVAILGWVAGMGVLVWLFLPKAPPKRCEDNATESECVANGCYWYNNSCHTNPEPTEFGTISGIITDLDTEQPIDNAKVLTTIGVTSIIAYTDANGAYVMNDMPYGTYSIFASKVGYFDNPTTNCILDSPSVVCNIALIPIPMVPGTIQGRVIDAVMLNGIPNASVEWQNHSTGDWFYGTTDGDGYYSISNVIPGEYAHVIVEAVGYDYFRSTEYYLYVNEGQTVTADDLPLITL